MSLFSPPLIVMSAPSGAGKTTIFKRAVEIFPALCFSVSSTTRKPRPGEVDGLDYQFLSREAFQAKIQKGEFLEWAEVHGNLYGTSRQMVQSLVEQGKLVVLDIDVQGAMQLKKLNLPHCKYLFIAPPDAETLRQRLAGRGTESQESLALRFENATWELGFQKHYDYVIINQNLDQAVDQFLACLLGWSLNPDHQSPQALARELLGDPPPLKPEDLTRLEAILEQVLKDSNRNFS